MLSVLIVVAVLCIPALTEECVDESPQCQYFTEYCSHSEIQAQCQKTCGVCGGGSVCKDDNKYCPLHVRYCSWHPIVKKQCKKTCELC
ncbi:uncharacterized protein ZK673.1-like [Oculina patagonica]